MRRLFSLACALVALAVSVPVAPARAAPPPDQIILTQHEVTLPTLTVVAVAMAPAELAVAVTTDGFAAARIERNFSPRSTWRRNHARRGASRHARGCRCAVPFDSTTRGIGLASLRLRT